MIARIKSDNFNGKSVNITFTPDTGGTININNVVIPYDYSTDYPYGSYSIEVIGEGITCPLEITSPVVATPTPTPTTTATPTPTLTPTPTPTPSPFVAVVSIAPTGSTQYEEVILTGSTNISSPTYIWSLTGFTDTSGNTISSYTGNPLTEGYFTLTGSSNVLLSVSGVEGSGTSTSYVVEEAIFPAWNISGDTGDEFMYAFKALSSQETFDYTSKDTFAIASTTNAYLGAITAPNKKVYAIPFSDDKVSLINTSATTATTIGSSYLGSAKWAGGVLALNGNIYGIPHGSSSVLKIDTTGDTTSLFGSVAGSSKYWGGALGNNGMIYCAPRNASSVLKIDPTTDTTSTFGSLGAASDKWRDAILAPNGKIYCAPRLSTDVLVIDPSTDTTSLIASPVNGFASISLAADGNLYCLKDTEILKIDPTTDTASVVFSGGVATAVSFDSQTTPDGNILGVSTTSNEGLIIYDYSANTITIEGVSTTTAETGGLALSDDGRVFAVPFNGSLGRVFGVTGSTLSEDFVLNRYVNKT